MKQIGIRPKRKLTGKVCETLTSVGLDLFLGQLAELDSVGTVDLLANGFDLGGDGDVEVVEELEVGFTLTGGDDGFSECASTSATLGPVVAYNSGIGTASKGFATNELEFCRSISAKRECRSKRSN